MSHDAAHRAGEVIQQYDAQGIHRTGTAVDAQSAVWLAEQVRAIGLTPALEPFPLSRVDPGDAFIEVDGRREEGLPHFSATFTGVEGVRGRLGPLGSDAEIGVAGLSSAEQWGHALIEASAATRHQAIVLPGHARAPGLSPVNAEHFPEEIGPPLLHVSSTARDWLAEAARAGATARVVAPGQRVDAEAFNVVAEVAGQRPELAPVIVLTPRSGWWQCASERGGGLVCWLELMRAVQDAALPRTVRFVATSGHELGYYGVGQYLAQHPEIAAGAHAWLHFGASIGAVGQPTRFVMASDQQLHEHAERVFSRLDGPSVTVRPLGAPPVGEGTTIHKHGGRWISMVGGFNNHFHLPSDRWPATMDTDVIAAVAARATELCLALATDQVETLAGGRP